MALLAAIEVGHVQLKKSGSKTQRKLKRLTWSINYEGNSRGEWLSGRFLQQLLWFKALYLLSYLS